MTITSQHMNGIVPILKQAIKEAIWSLTRHEKGRKGDIFLFSTRRSGSTLLMETIAANRGVSYIDQPFSLYHAKPDQLSILPIVSDSKYVELSDEDMNRVYDYLSKLLNGELKVNAPWEFWKSNFDWVSDRFVLKIVNAKGLIERISDQFDAIHIVYLIRHPIPTALSAIRNNWTLTTNSFLQNPHFIEKYMNNDLLAFSHDIKNRGDIVQCHVLNWTLENLIPLRTFQYHNHWFCMSYEEMILYPGETIEKLSHVLKLTDLDNMRRFITNPSRSTKQVLSQVHHLRNVQDRIRNWKKNINEREEKEVMKILERFEIDIYRSGSYEAYMQV